MHTATCTPRLRPGYIRTFYDDLSDIDWLRALSAAVPHRTLIADIGCGPGQFARNFSRAWFPVVSIDSVGRYAGARNSAGFGPCSGDR
jgi:SAM-dependent methyltransferase